MKRVTLVLLALSMLAACGNDAANPVPPASAPEGLNVGRLDDGYADGTYRVAETAIRFEVVVGESYESMRILNLKGNELFRSEILGNPQELAEQRADTSKWSMWHYGVALDSAQTMDVQPELMQWVNSQEAQLVASMWRDLTAGSYNYESGPLNALFRYGVHLEEAMAFDSEGLEDSQEALCSCYGKCGPGCFSVGSNWYCSKHDCCCRTYGSAACYSWCFVYPKCPAPICG